MYNAQQNESKAKKLCCFGKPPDIPWFEMDTVASVKRNANVRPSSDPSL